MEANPFDLHPVLDKLIRTEEDFRPIVVMTCGISGAGKSTLANQIIDRFPNFTRLSVDEIIFKSHGLYVIDYAREKYQEYQTEAQEILITELKHRLKEKTSGIILDLSFWNKEYRDEFKAIIEEFGGRWVPVFLDADKELLWKRITSRKAERDGQDSADRTGDSAFDVDRKTFESYCEGFERPCGEGDWNWQTLPPWHRESLQCQGLVFINFRHASGARHQDFSLFMEFKFTQPAPQSHFRGLDRRGTCDLVIPRTLGVNTDGIPTLFCQLLSRPQFGLLKNRDLARLYKHCLKRPHLQLSEAKNPFGDPSTTGAIFIELPVSCLASRIPTLFSNVKVRDVIWCVEAGDCGLCNGSRTLRVRGDERHLLCRYFDISTDAVDDARVRGLCPLCVGEKYFLQSLELQEIDPGHEYLSSDEYDAWERGRLIRLGFDG
ncbi:uncharacterized protein NECHADRAFT_87569 [Fusarium vanettenii 77-13-4]|uniref:Uncharacterized protein n=1 Tax=Fusarium vanettenii (strain ATCC MYA-4622 / CBS 123669 / FGSC 9596 / NRRL 45880 / 77-13-4) TaxID=660122 RepID=C7Z2E1_FUSV7|nr:uncharacterized protein NECHADRAFT_87569 [Fusarium vanettenii 77-13-4]EEU41644.1 hypothetical protein NECHADRAFT_87569 [Fusarium vanettenii 77-13-4]